MKLEKFIAIYGAKKLARALGIDDATVSQWKRSKAFPRPKHLREIVKLSKGRVSYESIINEYLRHNTSKTA